MKEYGQPSKLTRRRFIGLAGLGIGALALGGCGTPTDERRRSSSSAARVARYELEAAPMELQLGGRRVSTWGYGDGVPGPEIRLKEGETLRVAVRNRLPEGTSVHWHGVPLPNEMDGVPGVTQKPIKPGEKFIYEFEANDPGTYIYHSHVVIQLDRGLYGPLIVEPKNETLSYDKEFVVTLDDWLDGIDGTPEDALERLKSDEGAMEGMEGMEGQPVEGLPDPGGDAPPQWPPDLVYPLYLINGKPPNAPEEFEVRRGDRVRLRLINPSSTTIYRVALQGHRMSVTHTDGQPVEPVEVDALRIGMGERYDVLVEARDPGVWQLAAQAEGTKKVARAVFRYEGSTASAPPADQQPSELKGRMLSYDMLRAAQGTGSPAGEPDQVVPITLNGDEERYVWTINGQAFPDADPIEVGRDRRIRFEMENRSPMPHPMHLHGHFFRVDNGTGRGPLKDTVLIEPKERLAIDWVADNPGDWAFHCHQTYHAERGMTRVVKVA